MIFPVIIIFLFLNSLKIYLIDNFIAYTTLHISLNNIISNKFIVYFLLNSIIFILLLRLKSRFFLFLFYLLETAYLFTHLAYFLYFKDIFHIRQSLMQFAEGAALLKNFAIPKDQKYLVVLSDLPFFLFIAVNFFKFAEFIKINYKILNLRRVFFFASLISLLPLSYQHINIPAYTEYQDKEELEIVRRYGLFANDFLSCLLYIDEKSLIKTLNYGKPIVFKSHSGAQLSNIVCIQVESLDTNIIDFQYKGQYVAPFLHRLSTQCIYYPYMLNYRFGAGATSDIEFAVINSVIPLSYFPSLKFKSYDYPNSFVKRLSKLGYNLIAFHNNIGSFFNRDIAFSKFGFQEFYDLKKMKLKQFGWGAKDEDVLNYAKDKLKVQKSPFLYYIITMSSHEPFKSVARYYINKDYDDINEEPLRNYFNSMSYVDKVLEDFVSFVKDNIGNTYIFIWGDHLADIKGKHLFKQYNSLVPLFIITPDNKQYVENHQVASMLDLAPTILYASGISFEIMSRGANLLDFSSDKGLVPLKDGSIYNRRFLFRWFKDAKFED